MDNKIYVMGCIVDNAAFTSASTALIHYKGKKHRARVAVYIRHPMNEKLGVRIRDASKIPMVQILNYMSTLGSVQTVHLEDSFGINETFFQSAVIFYDSEDTVTSIRQSRHFVSGTQLVLSKYLINDDPLRPDTPPPPCKVEYLNDKEIDEQVRNLVKEHKDIDEQLDFMVQAIQLKPHELGVRRDICREIEDHFRMHLNQYAEVFAFGSSYTSFGFQGCTLDIHMSIKQGFPQRQEEETYEAWRQRCREREKMCVLNAGKLLRDHSQNKVSQVSLSLNSRVPVVKFMHKETGIKCEMGFKNRIAVAVSEFIRCCNNYDKRIKPLCLGIKYWATRYCLSGGPDVLSREVILSNYALTLMVIFFLQNEGILPTVKELQDNISPEENEKIDNWQVGFAKGMLNCPKEENPNRRSVTRLMYKFFEFYSEFEYKTMIISPYLGRPITKEMFVTPRKLRQTLPTYAITVEAGKNAPMVSDSPLVVQDPFELNNNVTKSLIKDALSIWKKMCTVAKEDFPREKFYRLFDLKDMPRELKSRKIKIREREKRFERERERKEKEQEEETAKLLESHTVPAMEPNNDLTMLMEEANDPMDEAINCDEADRMFVLNYVPGEIHQTYKDLLQTDPTRRYKDKFNSLAEIVIDHVLVHTLRFEHIGGDPPPTLQERKNEEPDAKKARKSRWGPDKQKYVDRKRLSEYDYQGFCPVWDFRKLTRKKFNYDDKTLEMEQVISEKICEKFGVWREMAPMAAFKVWTHHSKVYPGAVCVHAMDLESRRGIWYTAEKFLKVFLPYWTKQVIFFGTVEIDNL